MTNNQRQTPQMKIDGLKRLICIFFHIAEHLNLEFTNRGNMRTYVWGHTGLGSRPETPPHADELA